MSRFYPEMNTSSAAAAFGGCFAAYMTSLLLVFAGIALAVSVVFFVEAAVMVRLCFGILLGVIFIFDVMIPAPFASPMR